MPDLDGGIVTATYDVLIVLCELREIHAVIIVWVLNCLHLIVIRQVEDEDASLALYQTDDLGVGAVDSQMFNWRAKFVKDQPFGVRVHVHHADDSGVAPFHKKLIVITERYGHGVLETEVVTHQFGQSLHVINDNRGFVLCANHRVAVLVLKLIGQAKVIDLPEFHYICYFETIRVLVKCY